MPTPEDIDKLPDGPSENYKERKKRIDEGDDIYEAPTLRIKEKPKQEQDRDVRES